MFAIGHFLTLLFVGLIAGWLAGKIVIGRGSGVLADILIGVVGAFFGAWLFRHFGIAMGFGFLSGIVSATVGSVVLLGAIRLIKQV